MELAGFKAKGSNHWIIDHKTNTFQNTASADNKINNLIIIPLGFIHKRIAWPSGRMAKMVPLCKSPNNIIGYPTQHGKSMQPNDLGADIVNCDTCSLRQWTDGNQQCQKKMYIPFFFNNDQSNNTHDIDTFVQILELSRSGVVETLDFMKKINLSGTKAYYTTASIKAAGVERNGNRYCVPKYKFISTIDGRDFEYERKVFESFQNVREQLESDALPRAPRAGTLTGMPMGTGT